MERDLSEFLDKIDAAEAENEESVYLYDKAYDEGFADGYKQAVDEYMNMLCEHCMQQKNECYILECPFCTDGCDIVNIAEQMKGGAE